MKKNYFLCPLSLLLCYCLNVQGQIRADEEFSEDLYEREIVFGVNFNTYGGTPGGISFKIAKRIKHRHFHRFSMDIINIKHPKETSRRTLTGSSFIPFKYNCLYMLRPQYGREYTLFRKADQQGIQVNVMLAAGPAIALLAPYLIEFEDTAANLVRVVQQDYTMHPAQFIRGTGSILEGIFQANFRIGFSVKAAVSFEFGTFKESVLGFEMGLVADAFTSELTILQRANNAAIYPAAYVTFYFGNKK